MSIKRDEGDGNDSYDKRAQVLSDLTLKEVAAAGGAGQLVDQALAAKPVEQKPRSEGAIIAGTPMTEKADVTATTIQAGTPITEKAATPIRDAAEPITATTPPVRQ